MINILIAKNFEMDRSEGTDEAAALEDQAAFVHIEADIPLYDTPQMRSQGNYIAERLHKSEYRQGLRLWAGYPVSDPTWKPMKGFVHAQGKLTKFLWSSFWL